VGLNFSRLQSLDEYEQLKLFEDPKISKEKRDLQHAIDMIQIKFGKNKILRCSALLENSTIIERHNQIGGHRR
jgi:DNA polymerase V